MASNAVTAHASTEEMYERAKEKGIETIFDRYLHQQPQCAIGKAGVCCQLCSHGPCKITKKADKGICGANADTIVARNLLRLGVHGAAAYSHHLEEICKTLKATAQGKTPFKIQEPEVLKRTAQAFGMDPDKPTNELAIEVADYVLEELRKGSEEPLKLVEIFAPESRKEIWRRLGIFPGGHHSEIRDALTKTMTSIDTDPMDLLLTNLRLSISTAYMGLMGTYMLQDVLLGTPKVIETEADLGVLDPATVNIVAHGHVPLTATAVIQASQEKEMLDLARQAGAKGIKVYGSMCTGQELMQRSSTTQGGFAGQTGNWINQEFLIATGAVDLVMMDMNCTTPGMKSMADRFHTKLVSVDKILRMAGVSDHKDYDPVKVGETSKELVRMAIEAYKKRGKEDMYIPQRKARVVAGVGIESLLEVLHGDLDVLLNAIRGGSIKGIVAVVGCTTAQTGHDAINIALSKELIKRDILVINAGCASSAAQVEGLMDPAAAELAGEKLKGVCKSLGIPPCINFGSCLDIGRIAAAVTTLAYVFNCDPKDLPVAASAPEYLEQKAIMDGLFAVAFGLLTHIAVVPPVTGSELVTRTLTQDVEGLTGGRLLVETDPMKAADAIEAHILEKRQKLGFAA